MSDYVTTESLNSSLNSPLTAYQLVADMINYYTKEGSDMSYISIFELAPIKASILNVVNDPNNVFVNLRDNYNTKIINDLKYLDISYLTNITNNTNNINNNFVNLRDNYYTKTEIDEKAIDYTTISSSSFSINVSSIKSLYIVNHNSSTTITLNSLGVTLDGMILKFRKTTSNSSIIFIKGNTSETMLDITNNVRYTMTFDNSNYMEYMYSYPTDRYILLQNH